MLKSYLKRSRIPVFLSVLAINLGVISVAQAQESNEVSSGISGLTINEFGNPVPFVVIGTPEIDSIAASNEDGYFEINSSSRHLLFKHPEYYENRVEIKALQKNDTIKVRLTESFLQDPEKMDVLYGTVDEDNYLGSASTIYSNQLTTTLAPTLLYSLPGRLTGLYTQQTKGMRNPNTASNANQDAVLGSIPVFGNTGPNDNTEFFLSLRGQNPVTVIDGIQRNFFSIDPENIESISVQKDALSSIMLGMRSSRGVLLITTKKPDTKGFEVEFTGQTGVQTPLNRPEPLSSFQYAYLLNEALQNDGNEPAYTPADLAAFRAGDSPYLYPNVNWYDEVLRDHAPISSYNLNVKGGGGGARYFVGLGYFNQEGHFISSEENSYDTNLGLSRYLITTKLNIDVTDDLNLNLSLFGRIEDGNQPGAGIGTILSGIYTTPNNAYPIYNPDQSFGGNVSFTNNLMAQTVNSGYIIDKKKDAVANLDLKYELDRFVDGLSFRALTNISTQNRSATVRNKRSLVYDYTPGKDGDPDSYAPFGDLNPQVNNFVSVSTSRYWYGQLSLNYEKNFGKHFIDAKILGDQYVVSLNYDLPQKPADIAGDVKYIFDNKYFVEGAVNYSYYNRYKPGQQWGLFYAFGLGWDAAQESFLENADWLNKLKFRAIYGKTGSGIDNSGYYVWRQSFSESPQTNTYLQGYSDALGNGTYENSPLANPNITWEKAHKLNLGVDIALFDEKLNFTADYYYDQYYDLLQIRGRDIALIGFDYPLENIGKNLYKGIEASVTYQNNIGDFNYFVTANWSQNASEILFMDEQFRQEDYNRRTGQPVNAQFGLVADGFFNSVEEIEQSPIIEGFEVQPGDIRYKDLNGDGVINQFDQTAIANTEPLSFYGFNAGFHFKGFDVSVMLQGVYNRDIYVSDGVLQAGFQSEGQTYGQAYKPIVNRWTPETAETATYPRLTAGGNTYNTAPNFWATSFWVKSGNYFRVRNVSLAYTLPAKFTRGFLNSSIKLFVNGSNLFTYSDYDLVDPEVSSLHSYPILRTISGGINMKF